MIRAALYLLNILSMTTSCNNSDHALMLRCNLLLGASIIRDYDVIQCQITKILKQISTKKDEDKNYETALNYLIFPQLF
ncbi:CLUMA_CG015520, isoform A [Clunio marinus]|uniref:CLUMA_CG015520, isoform A n=1 Tax=Clunio marinus TaxID=568069 RepID=A0A1J1ISQ3_9DIPT|nr:CLUMA_CG015520, isoform A [Clunio marinus]